MEYTIYIPKIEWTQDAIILTNLIAWYVIAYFVVLFAEWFWRDPKETTVDIVGCRFFWWIFSPMIVAVCIGVAIFWLFFGRWTKS